MKTLTAAVRSTLVCAVTPEPVTWPPYTCAGVPYYVALEPKNIKLRFRESKNAREVLDFNLFLSPDDVWSSEPITNGHC